jgi:3-hydroxyisobutyrate dehydrogenase-like beta-hydroxyacid dehydrogenase
LVDVISQGAAGSWQMVNRSATMSRNEFDFGFAVEWMRKDLGFCLEEARRNGAQLPVTEIVDGYYAEVEEMGGRRWDTSSLIARLR